MEHKYLALAMGTNIILRKIYAKVDQEKKDALEASAAPLNLNKTSSSTLFIPYIYHD